MNLSIINLPRFEVHRPPLSLAILSAICKEESVDHSCLDFNLMIYRDLPELFEEINDFCITGNIDNQTKEKLYSLIDKAILIETKDRNISHFCLSLLSTWSQGVAKMFCERIRKLTNSKILLGGQGLAEEKWVNSMKDQQLLDHFIIGEGELVFRNFLKLKGLNSTPGFDNFNFQQIDDLDEHSVTPDYSLLKVNSYPYLDEPELYITGSRGCVRRCTYCDIGHQWKKFRYRSGNSIAKEMITQYERHGINRFFFTDSLVNGSMKMLEDLCDTLIEYRNNHPDCFFRWKGQYIFRPKDQIKESHIDKLKKAGADYLIVGLETGSDKVRFDMAKKHTTDDAEWFLEMFKKYDIKCHLLMLTGYVTETLDDHRDTLNLFKRWQKFVASETIVGIELGSTLSILEHSPIGYQIDEHEITMLEGKNYLWTSGKNPDLDVPERVRRRVEIHKEAMKYLFPITRSAYRLSTIRNHLIEYYDIKEKKTSKSKIIPIISSDFLE